MTDPKDTVPAPETVREPRHTLPKTERLCGRSAINALITKGRRAEIPGILRLRCLPGATDGPNRIMVTVPKRNFKRAVRRNLLKRRMRESYRLGKHLLTSSGTDILLVYTASEILPYRDISEAVAKAIAKINAFTDRASAKTDPHTDKASAKGHKTL